MVRYMHKGINSDKQKQEAEETGMMSVARRTRFEISKEFWIHFPTYNNTSMILTTHHDTTNTKQRQHQVSVLSIFLLWKVCRGASCPLTFEKRSRH